MSKLIFKPFEVLGSIAKGAYLWQYVQKNDLRQGSGIFWQLVTGIFTKNRGSRFGNQKDERKLLNSRNKGLVIDSQNKRLSVKASQEHLLLVAGTGKGKTTSYIIPNILTLADNENSIFINDPAGEIFELTSGYLQAKGFEVLKFDPGDPEHSAYYNPLRHVFDTIDGKRYPSEKKINLLVSCLVRSGLQGESRADPFWTESAKDIIEFLIKCLLNAPKEYHNLYNVYRLILAFTPDGKLLKDFMLKYANTPDLNATWLAFMATCEETLSGQIANAKTALRKFKIQDIAKITSKNSIDFNSMRQKKVAFFCCISTNDEEFYREILDTLYSQLIYSYQSRLPLSHEYPLYIIADEFGNSYIPNFPQITTTIRKFGVSLTIVLQSLAQLDIYGQSQAETILEGGIDSKLFYAGGGEKTTKRVERLLGVVVRDEVYTTYAKDERTDRKQYNLLNADEIRTLGARQAIFVKGNEYPLLLEIKPYYENAYFKNRCFGSALLKSHGFRDFELKCILD